MTGLELQHRLREQLDRGDGFGATYDTLAAFARRGGTREDARAVLEGLRQAAPSEAFEDVTLELLDVVEDWISAPMRLWPEEPSD